MKDQQLPEDDNDNDTEAQSEQFRRAAEATLQRLVAFLRSFEVLVPRQTTVADLEDPLLSPGSLYSIRGSHEDTWQVLKVLALDEIGVHVRLYGNAFQHQPQSVAPALLDTAPFVSLAPEDIEQEWPLSVGHLPLLAATFYNMRPVYITHDDVTAEELEEYNDWREAGGGYL